MPDSVVDAGAAVVGSVDVVGPCVAECEDTPQDESQLSEHDYNCVGKAPLKI